jgi:nucleotide-binding universal stress UspA family protein
MNRFANTPIVAPVDFSDEADKAVDFSLELASSPSCITAVHVAPPIVSFEPAALYGAIGDDERKEQLLGALHKRYADPKYRGVQFAVRFGDPGHEIVNFANEANAGLIVMPSHGRTGLAHILLGSVAERVVRLAPCPVLVLRA